MSTKSNKATVTKFFIEVINKKNLDLIGVIFSQNYLSHGMDGKEYYGMKDSIDFFKYLFEGFPDIQYAIDHIIEEQDLVAVSLTAMGTHQGEFLGYPPSFKRVRYKEMYFFRVLNDQIIERWGMQDVAGIKEQISKQ